MYSTGEFLFLVPQIPLRYSTASGQGSSVGVATDYGLDVPEIESRWGRDFPSVQTGPGAHSASCTMGTGSFLEVEAAEAWG